MKKITSVLMIVTVLLALIIPVNASKQEKIMLVTDVFYDDISRQYCLYAADENGEGWVIDIFGTQIHNKNVVKLLKKILVKEWIIVEFDDKDTRSIYDDEELNWYIMKD